MDRKSWKSCRFSPGNQPFARTFGWFQLEPLPESEDRVRVWESRTRQCVAQVHQQPVGRAFGGEFRYFLDEIHVKMVFFAAFALVLTDFQGLLVPFSMFLERKVVREPPRNRDVKISSVKVVRQLPLPGAPAFQPRLGSTRCVEKVKNTCLEAGKRCVFHRFSSNSKREIDSFGAKVHPKSRIFIVESSIFTRTSGPRARHRTCIGPKLRSKSL